MPLGATAHWFKGQSITYIPLREHAGCSSTQHSTATVPVCDGSGDAATTIAALLVVVKTVASGEADGAPPPPQRATRLLVLEAVAAGDADGAPPPPQRAAARSRQLPPEK
jgi:hypothetical protein